MTSETIFLTPTDLSLAALLVIALALVSRRMGLGLAGQTIVAAFRTTLQLCLVGLVLKVVFASINPLLIASMALVMLVAAAREVMARQKRRFVGWWGFGMGAGLHVCLLFCHHHICPGGHYRRRPMVYAAICHPPAGNDAGKHHDRHFPGP